jgi:hypothetical protein
MIRIAISQAAFEGRSPGRPFGSVACILSLGCPNC